MGETNPTYRVWEVGISLVGRTPLESGHERKQVGDILEVREPHHCIGRKERHDILWLRLEGLEDEAMNALRGECLEGQTECDKRRYCIPLSRLAEVVPGFREDWALDLTQVYQPFLECDEDTGVFMTQEEPLSVFGLVFDKHTMEYL